MVKINRSLLILISVLIVIAAGSLVMLSINDSDKQKSKPSQASDNAPRPAKGYDPEISSKAPPPDPAAKIPANPNQDQRSVSAPPPALGQN